MERQKTQLSSRWKILILTLGVFSIINTEMGVVGIIPQISQTFGITIPQAGWTVSIFALIVAVSAPVMPLLFSGINRRKVMLLALSLFTASNLISAFTESFAVLLIARALPAFFHPVYVSMAFTIAAQSVNKEDTPKAVSKIFIGVSAGMVLGVPITSFIASHTSFAVAMIFFAIVNAVVLLATLFYMPSMPIKEKMSYGAQLSVLKKFGVWHSILIVMLINGAMFGFFSYMSDFLNKITDFTFDTVSVLLLVYSLANITGNILAGKLFARHKQWYILITPLFMLFGYALLFVFGDIKISATVLVFLLGIFAGFVSIICQYLISHSASEAPDFANGLFLTAANLGTMIGTALCGIFIMEYGTHYSLIGTLVLIAVSLLFLFTHFFVIRKNKI